MIIYQGNLSQPQKATPYNALALEYARQLASPSFVSLAHTKSGYTFLALDQKEAALSHLRAAFDIAEKGGALWDWTLEIAFNLAVVSESPQFYDAQTLNYLRRAEAMQAKVPVGKRYPSWERNVAITRLILSEVCTALKQNTQALALLEQACAGFENIWKTPSRSTSERQEANRQLLEACKNAGILAIQQGAPARAIAFFVKAEQALERCRGSLSPFQNAINECILRFGKTVAQNLSAPWQSKNELERLLARQPELERLAPQRGKGREGDRLQAGEIAGCGCQRNLLSCRRVRRCLGRRAAATG